MNMRTVFPLFTLLLLPAGQAGAEQAYTWTDKEGVTHFSEAPPHDETIGADQINLMPAPSTGDIGSDDFYSVVNQADRMEKKRLENEKLIAERLKAEAEAKKAEAEVTHRTAHPDNTQEQTRYYPAYPYYPYAGHRPGQGHKPNPGRPARPEHLPAHKSRSSIAR